MTNEYNAIIVKEKIKEAFVTLRKDGYIARMNFMCCQTCGFAALEMKLDAMTPEKKNAVKGLVFYHSQDNDDLMKNGECYFAYDAANDDYTQEQVGQAISTAMKSVGLDVVWNGKETARIMVKMPETVAA